VRTKLHRDMAKRKSERVERIVDGESEVPGPSPQN
jgi:hypothetical protein